MNSTTKVILISGIGVLALIFGLVFFSNDTPQPQETNGTISFSEERWDFGDVSMADGLVSKDIEISNPTNSPVAISRLETSCMCTTAQVIHEDGEKSGIKGMVGHGVSPVLSEVIEPGETAVLRVTFDPNAHGPNATGPIRRNVSLETNSVQLPSARLTFTGNVTK